MPYMSSRIFFMTSGFNSKKTHFPLLQISLHRINNEPKKMISRHTSPTYMNGARDPIIEQSTMGIPKNSSPILDPHKTTDVSTKSSPIAVVADGEVVVFDDGDDWKGDCHLFLLAKSGIGKVNALFSR